jgi:hypothetical protein
MDGQSVAYDPPVICEDLPAQTLSGYVILDVP